MSKPLAGQCLIATTHLVALQPTLGGPLPQRAPPPGFPSTSLAQPPHLLSLPVHPAPSGVLAGCNLLGTRLPAFSAPVSASAVREAQPVPPSHTDHRPHGPPCGQAPPRSPHSHLTALCSGQLSLPSLLTTQPRFPGPDEPPPQQGSGVGVMCVSSTVGAGGWGGAVSAASETQTPIGRGLSAPQGKGLWAPFLRSFHGREAHGGLSCTVCPLAPGAPVPNGAQVPFVSEDSGRSPRAAAISGCLSGVPCPCAQWPLPEGGALPPSCTPVPVLTSQRPHHRSRLQAAPWTRTQRPRLFEEFVGDRGTSRTQIVHPL